MHNKFVDQVDMELKRAERYSVFVSVVILDLSFLETHLEKSELEPVKAVIDKLRQSIRIMDYISPLDGYKIGLLFPETPRQGAEIAGRRISEIVRDHFSTKEKLPLDRVIPFQMASYPDAVGNISVGDFLKNNSINSQN